MSFQYEPIAAALDYERRITSEELALIVDIGGGTSDFTVVRLSPDRHNMIDRRDDFLANNGVHIGGTDFDRRLAVTSVMQYFGMGEPLAHRPSLKMPGHYYFDLATWHKIHLLYDQSVLRELRELRPTLQNKTPIDRLLELLTHRKGHQLATLVENAKIELSAASQASVPLASLLQSFDDIEDCVVTRAQLEAALADDCRRIFNALDQTLLQAGLTHQQIDTVFTTGGSTALPLLVQGIGAACPNATVVAGDLYNSVGAGLLTEALKRYR
ncbi:MAG: Hsp70 family protein [Pseudomonadota bacterium]